MQGRDALLPPDPPPPATINFLQDRDINLSAGPPEYISRRREFSRRETKPRRPALLHRRRRRRCCTSPPRCLAASPRVKT
ncbi:hypothetical protein E2C01_091269 [Portunus trituberculatus]|uniref:Uncharacterized protein n=1 Tax=Portunus trituberculatus TaxID=210409 RepID=A0A5B7JNK4_PORTR|nr:hypothetical protein [Portunus trituberculatus]